MFASINVCTYVDVCAHINRSFTTADITAASIPNSSHKASENSAGSGPGPGRPRTQVESQDILNFKKTKLQMDKNCRNSSGIQGFIVQKTRRSWKCRTLATKMLL